MSNKHHNKNSSAQQENPTYQTCDNNGQNNSGVITFSKVYISHPFTVFSGSREAPVSLSTAEPAYPAPLFEVFHPPRS